MKTTLRFALPLFLVAFLGGCSSNGPLRVRLTPTLDCNGHRQALRVAVVDESGGAIPDAHVSILRKGALVIGDNTGPDGQVLFPDFVFSGPYTVRAEAVAFSVAVADGLSLRPGCVTTVQLPLRLNLANAECILYVTSEVEPE